MDSLSVIPGSGYSLLELFGQAGGFQWPIVATLAAGLVILMHCVVRLYFDRRAAGRLMVLPVGRSGANDFEFMLSSCGDSLYARLLTGLLRMHRAGGAFQALGQEVRIVASAARESYARTERLVTYCSVLPADWVYWVRWREFTPCSRRVRVMRKPSLRGSRSPWCRRYWAYWSA